MSLLEHDYMTLKEIAEKNDSSIQYYIICLIRKHLYNKHELLGSEIEVLRKSNYELHKIGVNINQIAKSINYGLNEKVDIERLGKKIKGHVAVVEDILRNNLNRS